MAVMVELRVLELICSRMAHDLVNPIGAVSNGIEFLEEGDEAMSAEAIALCRRSTDRATALLQAFRAAYGTAGSQSSFGLKDARRLATDFLAEGKCTLDWPDTLNLPGHAGVSKLLLNLVLLASEALPRGGQIGVGVSGGGPALTIAVTASGAGARMNEEMEAAMAPDADSEALSPKSVQAYFTARLAERLGGALRGAMLATDRVSLAVTLPAT